MSDQKPAGNKSPLSNIAHPDFKPRRSTPWGTVEGRVISLVSRKGGVGKTTSAVNLGAALALSGHTVLVVGTDPQCGVCRTLGVPPTELATCLSEIFSDGQSLTDMAHPSALPDLFFVAPRILTLEDEESYLREMERHPDTFIHEIDRARHLYDTILIDCPPGLGATARAALLASDGYLVPLQAEELCRDSVDNLLEFVATFRARNFPEEMPAAGPVPVPQPGSPVNRSVALEGVFLTMASQHTRMGRHVSARVQEDFGDVLFQAAVPRTTRLSEMALRGKPAVIYDRRSAGSRAYFDLADEMVSRYRLAEESMGLVPGSSIPHRFDPFGPEADGDGGEAMEVLSSPPAPTGGMDKLLADLGGIPTEESSGPAFEEPTTPEIVSLDDLLAEEENQGNRESSDEDWSDGFWNNETDGGERLN
ncbi:MAG: ParA family protein [Candidatus Krumholzibacteriota bacterium]